MSVSPTNRDPAVGPGLVERRRCPRSPCLENTAVLEWWERSRRQATPGRLLNISGSGALFEGASLPPDRESIWLRMIHPVQTPWIAARVVRIDPAGAVGLSFHRPEPELIEAATQGIDLGHLLHETPED